jgi:uncharacterized membrane protein
MDFSFGTADELSQKMESAVKKLDEKISGLGNLKQQRQSISKALKQFRNPAQPKE